MNSPFQPKKNNHKNIRLLNSCRKKNLHYFNLICPEGKSNQFDSSQNSNSQQYFSFFIIGFPFNTSIIIERSSGSDPLNRKIFFTHLAEVIHLDNKVNSEFKSFSITLIKRNQL
jgi:hypothetical protein